MNQPSHQKCDQVNDKQGVGIHREATDKEPSAPSGSESSVDRNSFMGRTPPSWDLLTLFSKYTKFQEHSEQCMIGRFDTTHELLRNAVATVFQMEKVGGLRAAKLSMLTDEVSRLNDVIRSLRAGKNNTFMTKPAVSQLSAQSGHKIKHPAQNNGAIVLSTEDIDSPPKVPICQNINNKRCASATSRFGFRLICKKYVSRTV